MDSSASIETHHDPHSHAAEHEHHELGWWRKYIFSTDHKVIGIQYGLCGLAFLFLGFCLMMLMRWQLAYPGQALPVIGKFLPHIFGAGSMPDGKMTPDFYNSLGAMHGTIMIFLGVVPLAFAAFGNFVVPLQIGAPDMTFPKVNAASYWVFVVGGIIMLVSFFVPGGAAKGGWTSYTPLGVIADTGPNFNPFFNGQTLWLLGFIFLITSSLLGAINFITTIIQLRAPGLTWMRLPFFVWAQFVTAFLLLLAFPPLEAAIVMQIMDRLASTSFFLPSGLVVNGAALQVSGGCSPLLWPDFSSRSGAARFDLPCRCFSPPPFSRCSASVDSPGFHWHLIPPISICTILTTSSRTSTTSWRRALFSPSLPASITGSRRRLAE